MIDAKFKTTKSMKKMKFSNSVHPHSIISEEEQVCNCGEMALVSIGITTSGGVIHCSKTKPPHYASLHSSLSSLSSQLSLLGLKQSTSSSCSNPMRARRMVTHSSMEAGIGVMGTKLGMMTYFEPTGKVVPVTVVGFREGNIVTQIKTEATDGYDSVQVGYRRVRDKKLTMPEMGHLNKVGAIPMRHLQEFRLTSVEGFEPNQRLVVKDIFKEGDLVDVSGTTIGKGFQGVPFSYTRPLALMYFVFRCLLWSQDIAQVV
ncbi:hypothetical protein IFM89_015218 [Coptis chinensis]|uniref:50S ribosomal protein L3, chloroplastic n=1 Tax=Coptis chinensis TaxID=261450 RepID=A0A835LI35_9MAGN|nr:hypothetical protein IFM89_015218 [Coptis chinensis]